MLTIIAKIKVKVDKVQFVKEELLKLIEPTRKDPGFIQYDLHQDNEDPSTFLFYEVWENRELWQDHMNAKPLADYMAATEGAIESFTLNEMTKISR